MQFGFVLSSQTLYGIQFGTETRKEVKREHTYSDCITWTDEAIYNVVFCESRMSVNLKSGHT